MNMDPYVALKRR